LIGAQYMLSDHFGLHADAGFGLITHSELQKVWDAAGTVTSDKDNQVTGSWIRPAYLGAVFYFN